MKENRAFGTPDDLVLDHISKLDDVIHVPAAIWIINKETFGNCMVMFDQFLAAIFDRFVSVLLESKSALPELTVLKECEQMVSVKVHGGMGPAVK